MEEKIVFENVRTKTKKSFVLILILLILAYTCFVSFFFVGSAYEYNQHIVKGDHYYECYNEKGKSVLAKCENNPELNVDEMLQKTEGADITNCDYYGCGNAFEAFIKVLNYDYMLFQFIIVSAICLLIISVTIYCIYSTKCKFSVTEKNIYGKKGFKKFDIAFIDIIAITQKRKGVIINTENNKLKLSPLKKCDEIFNYIKPLAPKTAIEQQSTSTVDDINLF